MDVPEPVYSAEKFRDMTVDGELEIECDSCGNFFIGDVWAGPAHCDIAPREHEDVNLSCSSPGYDRPPEDWNEYWELQSTQVQFLKQTTTNFKR